MTSTLNSYIQSSGLLVDTVLNTPLLFAGVQARDRGFTNGAGQIWLDNVACTGRENRLIDCAANALGVHNCNHGEDAGVRCPAERTYVNSILESSYYRASFLQLVRKVTLG